MIGIIVRPAETRLAKEFFELFKTPWEFYVAGRNYDAIITTSDNIPKDTAAKLLVIYSSKGNAFDADQFGSIKHTPIRLLWNGTTIPIYRGAVQFGSDTKAPLQAEDESGAVVKCVWKRKIPILRIGYDLFQEVDYLLTQGQPAGNASIPTLDLHIAFLRQCLWEAGISFVEIPPVPNGYDFMACLTHDVDFVGLRDHKCDRTMFGFLFRAVFDSVIRALRGGLAWQDVLENWKAALSLPLVHMGLRQDPWIEFDRYMEIERRFHSTFFFIPYKNHAGQRADGPAPRHRAAKYELSDVRQYLPELEREGFEVGVHGLDAWRDDKAGRDERERVAVVAGQSPSGVRMHWLYFNDETPRILEAAGFEYDSTFGYNECVGFRAGTTQVFCPPHARSLLEVPLNIQDTALFYPSRLNLPEAEALEQCMHILQIAETHGGVVTINWHTRSLSPERLWEKFYRGLLAAMQTYTVYFATAQQIATWFRKRRQLTFEKAQFTKNELTLKIKGSNPIGQPSFVVRIYSPNPTRANTSPTYRDVAWNGNEEFQVDLNPDTVLGR